MSHLGMRAVGSTVYVFVTTHAQTGAAVAPSSALEAADFILYKNGSATQRSSTAGWTVTSPFDSLTGLHLIAIDLSDDTDSGFYAAGSFYTLVLSPDETVDGLATIRVVASFDIGVQPANVTQNAGTAITAASGIQEVKVASMAANVVTATAIADNAITAAKVADGAIDAATFAANAITATAIANDAITDAKVASDVTIASVTGAVGSVTGNVGGNVAGSVGSVAGAVASVTAAVAITSHIKKNQALAGFTFLMTDSTNHAPAASLTVTVTRSIDGGSFASGTLSSVTEVGSGLYSVDFDTGDLNGKVIVLKATATGADTTFERIITQI